MGAETVITFDLSTFIVLVFAVINLVVLGPVSWILGNAIKDLRGLQRDFELFQKEVHLNYVRRNEYNKDMSEIKVLLKEIFDKMNTKVDK